MVQLRRRTASILTTLVSSAMLAGILVGVAQTPASATVTAVRGSACGFTTNVGLFGGPQQVRGCGSTVLPSDPTYSPSVTLPPGGSATPITASDPDGAKGTYGPATVFGGIWPPDVSSPTPSGPLTVSTQGTPAGGTVTSSADITLNPTPKPVVCAADANAPAPKPTNCLDPGGFGPPPVWGDSLHVECSASQSAVTGSTTFSNAFLAKASIVGGENDGSPDPAATEAVPTNPPPNYTRSGVQTNVGDTFTAVFNEQIVNPDGSLTVNAVHIYLFGPLAVGEIIKGQATCGVTPSPLSPKDTVAPTCGTPIVVRSNAFAPGSPPMDPRTEAIGVFDARGLQSIRNFHTNGAVQLGNPFYGYVDDSVLPYLRFVPGQTGPLPILVRQTDPGHILTWSFDAVDKAGNVTHCSGVGDNPPVANDDTYSMTASDTSLSVPAPGVLANDTDVDVANNVYGNTMSAHLTGNPANDPTSSDPFNPIPPDPVTITTANGGTVVLSANGSFTYTPAPGFGGTDIFTYAVRDGAGGSDTATVTIDVAPLPILYVSDVTVAEGNSGSTPATFTITRTGDTSATSTVSVTTTDNTAGGYPGGDYTPVDPTTVTFAPGQTSQTVSVDVNGDTDIERNETFNLVLSAPTGATIGDASGKATIVNDDSKVVPGPTTFLSVADTSVTEGTIGTTTTATFTVTRSGDISGTSTVQYVTETGGTATAGSDYTAVTSPTTLTFNPGETSKTVDVVVFGDTVHEANETFKLALSAATGATISDASATATIFNDDAQASFIANDYAHIEGDSGATAFKVTITRVGDTSGTSTVRYQTSPDSKNFVSDLATAAPGNNSQAADFVGLAPKTITFGPGVTKRTITVYVIGDTAFEYSEHFFLVLSNPKGATIADGIGRITIVDEQTDF